MGNIIRLTETQLTNIIKRIVNESTTSELLKDMIKTDGWKNTSDIVGDSENLKELTNIQTIGDLLGLYLEMVTENNEGEVRFFNPNEEVIIKLFTDGDGRRQLAVDSNLLSSLKQFCDNNVKQCHKEIIEFLEERLERPIDYVRSWPIKIY
jgi:hypothetical protein